MSRFVVLAFALVMIAVAGANHAALAAGTTHNWVGLDTKAPHDWKKAKNWSTNAVPQDGDSVYIKGAFVQNAPNDIHIATVTLEDNASILTGGPLFVDRLEMHCATLAIGATVNVSGLVTGGEFRPGEDGPFEVLSTGTFTVRKHTILDPGCGEGTTIEPGLLKLFSGVTFRNSGVLGGDGTVEGMTCCTNPQVLNNGNTGKIDGSDGITLLNLRLLNRGKIAGGTLNLVGGDHIFRTGSRLVSVDVTAETARISVPDENPNVRASVTLAEHTIFTVTGGTELYGPADWIGKGILELREGIIYGDQTIGPDLTLLVSGRKTKSIRSKNARNPGVVTVDGKVTLSAGRLQLGGRLDLHEGATATVLKNSGATIAGLTCCRAPIPTFENAGTIRVEKDAVLALDSMRLTNVGTVDGPGRLVFDGGDHRLEDGSSIEAPVGIKGGAIVRAFGTVKFDSTVDQYDRGVLRGGIASPVEIAGTGSWTWRDGEMHGRLSFGPDIEVSVKGVGFKSYATPSTLEVGGPLRIEGQGELRLAAGATLDAKGDVTLAGANVTAGNCCTDPATFIASGDVTVERAAGVASLNSMEARFANTVDLNGGILEIDSLDPVFQGGAKLQLEGGALRASGVVLFRSGSVLQGPGTVVGNVAMTGTVRFGERGRLLVKGGYRQEFGGRLEIKFAGAARDLLEVDGPVELAGQLNLSGTIASITRAFPIVKGTSLTGEFNLVTGLPASKQLQYGPNEVVVAPR